VYEGASPLGEGDFIGKWMSQLVPAAERVRQAGGSPASQIRALEFAAVEQSLNNLKSFPYIAERLARGEIALHGSYFGVAAGLLYLRDPQDGAFAPCPVDPSLLD